MTIGRRGIDDHAARYTYSFSADSNLTMNEKSGKHRMRPKERVRELVRMYVIYIHIYMYIRWYLFQYEGIHVLYKIFTKYFDFNCESHISLEWRREEGRLFK